MWGQSTDSGANTVKVVYGKHASIDSIAYHFIHHIKRLCVLWELCMEANVLLLDCMEPQMK